MVADVAVHRRCRAYAVLLQHLDDAPDPDPVAVIALRLGADRGCGPRRPERVLRDSRRQGEELQVWNHPYGEARAVRPVDLGPHGDRERPVAQNKRPARVAVLCFVLDHHLRRRPVLRIEAVQRVEDQIGVVPGW